MSPNKTLIKATINRIASRLSESLYNSLNKLSTLAKDAPDKIKEEWVIFQEEVIEEVERMSQESNETSNQEDKQSQSEHNNLQSKIDHLREEVARLSKELEERR